MSKLPLRRFAWADSAKPCDHGRMYNSNISGVGITKSSLTLGSGLCDGRGQAGKLDSLKHSSILRATALALIDDRGLAHTKTSADMFTVISQSV